ncbi:alpha/beta fold hydrolase [Gemmobacter denitrificans]|uniref:Alpha/beta fold hydrolase n=1 Tax=Gemmobacter denitrificans TaxID=3123040 RepID=A0ABU8BT99_9RHOB
MRFVFVHGSCHGAWCWRDVLPFFNNAQLIDLPKDPSAATLESYAATITNQLEEPSVLVGHSAGGYAITAAAEAAPDRVSGLIYICAYVPQPGQSLAQMRRAGPSQPLADAIRVSPDRASFSFDPALIADRFYHDCPPETLAYAAPRLRPEPIRPQETPMDPRHTTGLPRAYVHCAHDRAIPPAYQLEMARGLPLISLASGHSPFFSMPERLADALQGLAQSF